MFIRFCDKLLNSDNIHIFKKYEDEGSIRYVDKQGDTGSFLFTTDAEMNKAFDAICVAMEEGRSFLNIEDWRWTP